VVPEVVLDEHDEGDAGAEAVEAGVLVVGEVDLGEDGVALSGFGDDDVALQMGRRDGVVTDVGKGAEVPGEGPALVTIDDLDGRRGVGFEIGEFADGGDELEEVGRGVGVDVGVAGIGFVGADGEHGFIAEVVDAEADGDLEAEVGEALVEEAPESGGADTG
jgi:hypothetical protein